MATDVDKIYCMDHSNNDALAYLAGQNRNSDPDGTIISADKEGIIREVEAIQNNVKEALEKVEQHKLYLKCCDGILASLNPAIAERKEQDKRIANLEQGFGDMRTILQDISQTLKNLQK